jgi:hypothetical protein
VSAIEIDPRLGVDLGDSDIWGRQIVDQQKRNGKAAPSQVDLETAIGNIRLADTMQGSSTIVLTIQDPEWILLDSGFFDANKDGKLDGIDVNYPDGSELWWRLSQVGLAISGTGGALTLTFLERTAVYLMQHHGPVKFSRAKKTRAETVQWMCAKVKKGGGITFHCSELHTEQPQAKPDPQSAEAKKKAKGQGLAKTSGLTIQGAEATDPQLHLVEVALDVAKDLKAPHLAVIALLVAGIGESGFTNVVNSLGYGGVFQGQVAVPGGTNWFAPMGRDKRTHEEAKSFLLGGRGYNEGGAIYLAKHSVGFDAGEIATRVETSGQPGSFYGKWKSEADKLLEAYGGGGFGSTGGGSYRKQYNFKIGPHEDFWAASGRLADEVNWAFFIDGTDVYFDLEMQLIKQKPIAVIRRGHPAVVSFDSNWDMRHIATEATLTLICNPFEFRAGQVFVLEGFGPASTGSTAKPPLPGRWLIDSWDRDRYSLATTFSLRQPEKQKAEPRSELVQRSAADDAAEMGTPPAGSPKDVIDNAVLPIGRHFKAHAADGSPLTPANVARMNASHGPTSTGGRSDHQGPPSQAWAADMGIGSDMKKGDELCAALAKKFHFSGNGAGSFVRVVRDGYSYQLLWRVPDHFDHVHFGVQIAGGSYNVPVPRH